MEILRYPDSDAIYVRLRDTQYGGGRVLDDCRHLDLDLEGDPLGILFLYISDGVDLEDIPGVPPSDLAEVCKMLAQEGVRIRSAA